MNPRRVMLRILLAACVLSAAPLSAGDAGDLEFFEKKIRPVLVEKCYQCHSAIAKDVKGGLLVDHRDALLKGGETGAAVVPGKVDESLLVAALKHDGLNMPPDEKLPAQIIADFERWIEHGAPDPRETPASPEQATATARTEAFAQLERWWSLQPPQAAALPAASGESANRIDRFIHAKLSEAGLSPARAADRRTLIRRLTETLIGLPPTPDEATVFESDPSPGAYATLVDRLLASPHFGEHWARHWMDVVRYTDTYGYEWDIPAKGAWRYRDYLIRAFNEDVPFDQLIREQIAGDLLEQPRINAIDQINESRIGPMFFQMGEKRHGDSSEFDGIHQEMLDNKIDAFSKAFQATTIACARCHDHKLDAVRQAEYYALGGVFLSSRWVTNTVDLPSRHDAARAELADAKKHLRKLLAAQWRADVAQWAADPGRFKPTEGQPVPPPMEDLRHPWQSLKQSVDAQKNFAEVWQTLAEAYRKETETRTTENRGHFTVVADFRNGIPESWSVDGVGLEQVTPRGELIVSLEGDAVINAISYGGLVTNSDSPRMNGAVRTPWLNTLESGHLSFEVAGGDFASRRSVIDNAFLTEKQVYLDNAQPQWILMGTFPEMPQRHNYLEIATKSSNPNFPPRVGLGGACTEQQVADPRSWFAVSRVVRHVAPFTPKDELTRFAKLFEDPAPTNLDEVATRTAALFAASIDAWEKQSATDDDVRILNDLLAFKVLSNSQSIADESNERATAIRNWVNAYRRAEPKMAEPWTVNGMADLDPGFDARLFDRGDYDQPREAIPRGYLQAVSHQSATFDSPRSGRRELAELIASSDNPLTARVFVNRVWQWLFGTGLVATTNDFGHLGERPSHPELLDDLSVRFMREGWSLKRLIREIVLSETWRQSGECSPEGKTIDPANRLLHHYSLRRLEAEPIRDAMLAVTGRFDPSLYGPPINPHRQNEDDQKRLFSGPMDGLGRRSLYIKMTIMEPPRMLALFNQPPPKIPTGTRDVTNTPAQSLALLNDPFVFQVAENWAQSLVLRTGDSLPARIDAMFQQACGRSPTTAETERWSELITTLAAETNSTNEDLMTNNAVWKQAAHTLLNTKEFIYIP